MREKTLKLDLIYKKEIEIIANSLLIVSLRLLSINTAVDEMIYLKKKAFHCPIAT